MAGYMTAARAVAPPEPCVTPGFVGKRITLPEEAQITLVRISGHIQALIIFLLGFNFAFVIAALCLIFDIFMAQFLSNPALPRT